MFGIVLMLVGLISSENPRAAAPPQTPATTQSSTLSAPNAPLENPKVIRVEVPIVTVNVVAVDGRGRPVTGLTKTDFQVYENNVLQTITNFEYADASAQTQQLPSITSDLPRASNPPNYMIFLFDNSTMEVTHQKEAERVTLQFIDQNFRPGDYVALAYFRTSLQILQNFTNKKDRIKEALSAIVTGAPPFHQTEDPGGIDPNDAFQQLHSMNYMNRGDRGLSSALNGLANSIGPIKGRISIIAFSDALGLSSESNDKWSAAISAMSGADITVYTVLASPRKANFPPTGLDTSVLMVPSSDSGIAATTNTSDFKSRLREIESAMRNYYSIGYESSNQLHDGKFRSIRVEVKKRGIRLQYHKGYSDQKPQDAIVGTPAAQQLTEAIQAMAPMTALPVQMVADYFYESDGHVRAPVYVRIPINNLKAKRPGPNTFDVMGVAFREDGSIAARFSDTIPVEFDENQLKSLPVDAAITYPNSFNLATGSYRLKVAVQNQMSVIGTVEETLDIPAYQAHQLASSSLVLVDDMQPMSNLLGDVEAQLLDQKNPLVFKGTKILPSVTRTFHRNGSMTLFFTIYNLAIDPVSKAPTLLVSYSIMTPQRTLYELPLTRLTQLPKMENGTLPLALTIPLGQFPLGAYTVQIMLRDGLTNANRYISDQFEVQPDPSKK